MPKKILIIGGGAAGFFAAINYAEANPEDEVTILEKSAKLLAKVKVSGGGRCNVTHACFDPKELVKFYPRGNKALLGPFHQFMTGDVFDWFEKKGVELKIEEDNRVFPGSNSSQTIVSCFLDAARDAGIRVHIGQGIKSLQQSGEKWEVTTDSNTYEADKLLLTTGSSVPVWNLLKALGHSIVEPVPSLFTFKISDERIKDIPGVAVPNAHVKVCGKHVKLAERGPLLITHWGLSGPAVLKLSAWGARTFQDLNYQFSILVNWIADWDKEAIMEELMEQKHTNPRQKVDTSGSVFQIPKRLWSKLCTGAKIGEGKNWADLSHKEMNRLVIQLTECEFAVEGKSTNKDEFVTSGGVDLNEVDFKRFESKLFPNLFFAGEILDIDAVTGGFNFQNAWTGAWIAANAMGNE